MNGINLAPAYPELVLLVMTIGILIVDMYLPRGKQVAIWILSLAAITVCIGLSCRLFLESNHPNYAATYIFENMFVADAVSSFLKICTCIVMLIAFLYSHRYIYERNMLGNVIGGEFYVLALFCLLGQLIVISSANFLILYLGIELIALPLYAMVAMKRNDNRVSEAAIKYFILGALGSGFLLYGISMLYGATGTLDLKEVAHICALGNVSKTILIFGVVFIVSGMAFKLGVAPFHMWVPDVYEGAPTAVTLLIGSAPKLAGFAIFLRVLIEGLSSLAHDWQQMLVIISVLSLTIGNITALSQTNIKRMLAYSTIGQMGFMLLGMLSGVIERGNLDFSVNAYSSSLFYTLIYVLAVSGAFGIVLSLSQANYESDKLDDFRGLHKRSPWHAFMMMLFMLSLAGIPPLAGFYAKWVVLEALVASGRVWLAVFAVVLSVVGAFYYLRVVKLMYFDQPVVTEKVICSRVETIVLSFNTIAIIVLGVLPGFLMTLCYGSIHSVLAI